jgi:hypothetical protein
MKMIALDLTKETSPSKSNLIVTPQEGKNEKTLSPVLCDKAHKLFLKQFTISQHLKFVFESQMG